MNSLAKLFTPDKPRSGVLVSALLLAAYGCGGEDEKPPTDKPPAEAGIAFAVGAPCGLNHPTPTDLFSEAVRVSCGDADDPIDAAIERVELAQRAPLDARVRLPLTGAAAELSLSSTVAIEFDGRSGGGGLPAWVLIEETPATGTSSKAHSALTASMTVSEDAIELEPTEALTPDRFHAVVVTKAAMAADGETPLAPSPAVQALVGATPIAAGAYPELDADGAARLEAMRVRLQDVLDALAKASPPVSREDIVSIHGFTTRAGDQLYASMVARYEAAVAAGVYGYDIRIDEADIPPSEIYIGNEVRENVSSFVRGVVMVPKFLDGNRFRADWETNGDLVEVPFLLSIPTQGTRYKVAVQVVGFGRSRIDARALANAMGGAPTGSAMAIELRCHGSRAPGEDGVCTDNRSEEAIDALKDEVSNNGNEAFSGSDGIPDASGIGFFPGDPLELVDTQIASALEIIHVLATLRRNNGPFEAESIPVDTSGVHLVAQGALAVPGAAAAAFAPVSAQPRTVQFPAGGTGLSDLVLNGPDAQKAAFLADLPSGIAPEQGRTLLTRLAPFLAAVQVEAFASKLIQRYTFNGQRRALLLPHPRTGTPGKTQFVSAEARDRLDQQLDLPSRFRSEHLARCDDYFIYTCKIGDNGLILDVARSQIAGFISSNGATVPPAYSE